MNLSLRTLASHQGFSQRSALSSDQEAKLRRYTHLTGGWEGGQAEYCRVCYGTQVTP